jgi:hypothetical protein
MEICQGMQIIKIKSGGMRKLTYFMPIALHCNFILSEERPNAFVPHCAKQPLPFLSSSIVSPVLYTSFYTVSS